MSIQYFGSITWAGLSALSQVIADLPLYLAATFQDGLVYQATQPPGRRFAPASEVSDEIMDPSEGVVGWRGYAESVATYFEWVEPSGAKISATKMSREGRWYVEYQGPAGARFLRLLRAAVEEPLEEVSDPPVYELPGTL